MKPENKFVQVRVETTSGSYPEDPSYEEIPENQPVSVLLKKVEQNLNLTNTNNWVLRNGSEPLAVDSTWAALGLAGQQLELDWGPNAGGGGNA